MVRIRLRRMGTRSKPFYRVVVSDSRLAPTGPVVESLGFYDPRPTPPVIRIDAARADYWIRVGAQPTPTVRTLLRRAQG